MRSLDNQIGAITNIATYYVTKGSSKANVNKHDDQLVLLRILQGQEIDYSKSGIRVIKMPEKFEKVRKYKPYFLQKYKYEKDYGIMQFVDSASMNLLCRRIEKWERNNFTWDKWEEQVNDTSEYLMNIELLNRDTDENKRILAELEIIYADFREKMSQYHLRNKGNKENKVSSEEWSYLFESTHLKANKISKNKELLSTIAVYLCYIKHKKDKKTKSYLFPWVAAWEGLSITLSKKQSSIRILPERIKLDKSVKEKSDEIFEIFGKHYIDRVVEMQVDANKYIKEQYKQIREKNKKKVEIETVLYGMKPRSALEIKDILEKDNVVILNPWEHEGKKFVSIFKDDEYLSAVKTEESFEINEDGQVVNLKEYYNRKFLVEVKEVSKSSMTAKLRLIS